VFKHWQPAVIALDTPEVASLWGGVPWETGCYWVWLKMLVRWGLLRDDDGTMKA